MDGKSQYLVYGSHSCCDGGHTGLREDYYVTWVTPTSVMVISAAVITLAVPTAVMASKDRSTAVRTYNVLSLLLIYYAHREEHYFGYDGLWTDLTNGTLSLSSTLKRGLQRCYEMKFRRCEELWMQLTQLPNLSGLDLLL